MKIIKKLFYFFSAYEQRQAIIIVGMTIVMALLDMIGVASIMPFIAVLTNPGLVETNPILNMIYIKSIKFGIESEYQFLFFLGILVFIILVFSLIFKSITTYVQLRFCYMREFSICKRLIESYLHQPYSWFLNRDSSELGKSILSETSLVVSGGIRPVINIISQLLVVIALSILLILINPKISIMAILIFSFCYGVIYKLARGYLNHLGKERTKANELRFSVINDAFGAAKEVKVGGLEENYIKLFLKPAKTFSLNQASLQVIGQLPRFGLEAIIFGSIILIILFLMGKGFTFTNLLPLLALYAFAGYRILPALQQVYFSMAQLRFISPALDKLHNDLKNLQEPNFQNNPGLIKFEKKITLNNVNYIYPNSSRLILKDINLDIEANSTVGFVGSTGSGKTTIVDIILGLLEAKKGTVEVDGKIITKQNVKSWQRSIGYVPQSVYLANDTIARNIAFGVDNKNLNIDTVMNVSKIANLNDFVENELPEKYQTVVGERGARLSGGQLQRIGIARALYHKPKLLILDEATSALDSLTEQAVMEAIFKLKKKITIIIITHRLSTIKICDNIFYLKKGEIKSKGTFNELIDNDKNFSLMVDKNNEIIN